MFQRWLSICCLMSAACLLGAENLMQGDSSFETGYGPWRVTGEIVEDNGVDGSHCLCYSYDIMSDATYNLVPDKPHVFSVWLKSDVPGTAVRLQAYRTNWDGRSPYTFVNISKEWKRYELTIPPQKFGDHNVFWMHVTATDNKTAKIYMDATQIEVGTAATDYVSQEKVPFICEVLSPVQGQIFFTDEKVRLSENLYNASREAVEVTAALTVKDYYGATVFDMAKKVSIAGKSTAVLPLEIPDKGVKGIFFVSYSVTIAGQKTEKSATYCVLDRPVELKGFVKRFFGICGGTADREAACARMGVQAQAISLRWAYMTKDRQLNPEQAKGIVKAADRLWALGIEPIVYFRRTPPWAAIKPSSTDIYPPSEEFIKDYETFTYLAVNLLKGRVKTYQLWGGEADLTCDHIVNTTDWTRERFMDTLVALWKAGYQGAKRADPDCIVETSAVSGVDCSHASFAFQGTALEAARGYYDKAVCHPYCYPSRFDGDKYVQSPEENGIVKDYEALHRLSGGKPITNGEYGFSIKQTEPFDSKTSRLMGAYMARSFLLTASCPEVDRFMYYTVANSDEYSIFSWPNPRVAVAAYSALARRLTGFVSCQEVTMGSLAKAYVYGKADGSSMAALWIPQNRGIEFALSETAGIEVSDMIGNAVRNPAKVLLSGEPTYFSTSRPASELAAVLSASRLLIDPVSVSVRVEDSHRLRFYVSNQLNEELNGSIEVTVPTLKGMQGFTVPLKRLRPALEEKLLLEIPAGIDVKALNGKTLEGVARTEKGEVPIHEKMAFLFCPRAPGNVAIDGNLKEWEGRKAIRLNTMSNLFPPDAASHGLWTGAADLSVDAYVAWDDTTFYFAACVYDDRFNNDHDVESLWNGDCIQMGFDPNNDARVKAYEADDCEINISYSSKVKGTCISRSWPMPVAYPKTVKGVAKVEKGRIIYELAIPFEYLRTFKAYAGKAFRYNFVAVDCDLKYADYWMGISYGICGGKDASAFPVFILSDDSE